MGGGLGRIEHPRSSYSILTETSPMKLAQLLKGRDAGQMSAQTKPSQGNLEDAGLSRHLSLMRLQCDAAEADCLPAL